MRRVLFALLFLSLLACKGDSVEPDNGYGDISIRIWNGTNWEMTDVFVDTSGGENDFGKIEANRRSNYKHFTSAYRYAFVSFKIDGKPYLIQPIDYVGEIPLEKGRYTYKINIDNLNSVYATLEFIED